MIGAKNEGLNLTPGYIKEGRARSSGWVHTRGEARARRRRLYAQVIKEAKRAQT